MHRLSALPSALVLLALAGCNAAPIAPLVQILPEDAATEDDLRLDFLSRSEDPNLEDVVTYEVAWYVDGEEVPELKDQHEVNFERTAKNQQWRVAVTPVDSRGAYGQAGEATVTIQNTAPTAEVELTPLEPQPTSDIEAVATGYDIDGDEVSFRYEWLEEGVESGHTDKVLPADMTKKGDLWTVRAYPTDGQDEGEPAEATVSVDNALPIATLVTLTPREAFEKTELLAEAEGTDEDGDELTWTFTWYVDGEAVEDYSEATLTGEHFDKGAKIRVEATPHDGYVHGESAMSDYAYVFNTKPTGTAAALAPTEAYTATTLNCVGIGFADDDNDEEGWTFAWQVNGVDTSRTGQAEGGFTKGDTVSCFARPFDGEEEGDDAYKSAAVTILNTPPVMTKATISKSAPVEGDTLEVYVEGVSDDDGDDVTLKYSWLVNGTSVATTATLSSDLFDKGDTIQVEVTPNDGTDDGVPVRSAIVTAVNTAPEATKITLAPTSPYTDDEVVATVETEDADGDDVTLDFAWYVDGTKVSATGAKLDGSYFDKHDKIYVIVTPNDGDTDGAPLTSDTITAINTIPVITSVEVTPDPIREEDTLTCVPKGWTDADGDTPGYEYSWEVDGKKVATTKTLTGDFFDKGDAIVCTVRPDDGDDVGKAVSSKAYSVANTAPTIDSVSLSSKAPKEGDTLYATIIGAEDVDGDPITYHYAWHVNGKEVSTKDEIDSSVFDKGDSIYVVVTPDDGTDKGTGVKSDVATGANTVPEVTSVSLSPTSPKTTDGVTATVVSKDADGDTVSYSYTWYVDGLVAASKGKTLSSADFKKNQKLWVVVVPDDGDGKGAAFTSGKIDSVNTLPSITGVAISPATGIKESTTLTCVPSGWSDADGDAEGYRYEWKVNGALKGVSKTLLGTFFSKGDKVTCTAWPNDGEGNGTPRTSASVSVENTAPVLDSVTPVDDVSRRRATRSARCWARRPTTTGIGSRTSTAGT